MDEKELETRARSLSRDLLRAVGLNSRRAAFTTFDGEWVYLVKLVEDLAKTGDLPTSQEGPPSLLTLIRADILPQLLYILANYTPPPFDGPDGTSTTVSTTGPPSPLQSLNEITC